MSKALLGIAALIMTAGSASAADMAVKARPMAAAPIVYSWTGFYIGANVGAGFNDTSYNTTPTGFFTTPAFAPDNGQRTNSSRFDRTGFTGGVQAGYNWQAGVWVWGVEADINYLDGRQTNSFNRALVAPLTGNFIHSQSDRMEWFGTFRGRVGWTASPAFLLYATGGLAYGQVRSASNFLFTAGADAYAGSTDTTRVGYTVGAGGEYKFSPNWSFKAEYLYVDLGRQGYTSLCTIGACVGVTPPATFNTDLRIHEHIARVGLNYQFNSPVVARY
jgi:outer membrane immunogenic protein